MSYYGTTPTTAPQTDLNLDALTIGFSKVIIDASWIGALKEGSKAIWNMNPLDKDIITPAYPGTRLGVRQLGASPTLTFEAVESTLANIRQFMDVQASVNIDRLSIGQRKKVATTHTVDAYGEGPGQRTRKLALYRVRLRVDGDVNLFDGDEFTSWRVVCEILPDMNLGESEWFGELVDSPPM